MSARNTHEGKARRRRTRAIQAMARTINEAKRRGQWARCAYCGLEGFGYPRFRLCVRCLIQAIGAIRFQ